MRATAAILLFALLLSGAHALPARLSRWASAGGFEQELARPAWVAVAAPPACAAAAAAAEAAASVYS